MHKRDRERQGAYLCKTWKKSRTSDLRSWEACTPLTDGFGGTGRSSLGSLSSVDSRFRLVEELTEAGESGRDRAATPLAWGARTAGEAMALEIWTPEGAR